METSKFFIPFCVFYYCSWALRPPLAIADNTGTYGAGNDATQSRWIKRDHAAQRDQGMAATLTASQAIRARGTKGWVPWRGSATPPDCLLGQPRRHNP